SLCASAVCITSEPSRRISACNSPMALPSASSERNELEQTSSANCPVLWAAVGCCGPISCKTPPAPRRTSRQAASEPAKPPPMIWTGCDLFIGRETRPPAPKGQHRGTQPAKAVLVSLGRAAEASHAGSGQIAGGPKSSDSGVRRRNPGGGDRQ